MNSITRNTIMLYVRMLIVTVVALYTSRIVLQTLGVNDFGIYTIVGGIVTLFSILNTSLTNAAQRFLTVAVGKKDEEKVQIVFSTVLLCQILLACLIFMLAETIGLWFLNNKLNIPEDRLFAAQIAYHFSILFTCINVIRVPYNATIIANEKMDYFAYTSIVETVLKLLIVYLLIIFDYDKLILYAILQFCVAFIILIWYKVYVDNYFSNNKFRLFYDGNYFRNILQFSGWNILGSTADVGYRQGTNIILNLFYGVALNASMGIFIVVRTTVASLVSNLQIAANPQIIKRFTCGEHDSFEKLVCQISKYSYYLMLLIALPFAINVQYILEIWLGQVPDYTADFLIIGMVFSLVDSLHGPLWTSVIATGKIKTYQIVTSLLLLLNLPLSYMALKFGLSPQVVLWIQVVVSVITLLFRIIYAKLSVELSLHKYLYDVLLPVLLVTILTVPASIYIAILMNNDLFRFFVTCSSSVLIVLLTIYFGGLNSDERKYLSNCISGKICKIEK